MLVLTRRLGESVIIDDRWIRITVTKITDKQAKLMIVAPREVVVAREEVYDALAAKTSGSTVPTTLILARKVWESVVIGDRMITVTVKEIKGKQVKLAFDAPREVIVCREEIFDKFWRKRAGR